MNKKKDIKITYKVVINENYKNSPLKWDLKIRKL